VESEFAGLYEKIGLGTTTWSPLASGILTGKYAGGVPEGSRITLPGYEWLRENFESEKGRARIAKAEELRPVAEELGCTLAQLAIAWCLSNDDVSTVILGASRPGQLTENLKALGDSQQERGLRERYVKALSDAEELARPLPLNDSCPKRLEVNPDIYKFEEGSDYAD